MAICLCHQSIGNVHHRLAAASLPANGSYLQCSVRLHKQIGIWKNQHGNTLYGSTTPANYNPFLNQTLITLVDACIKEEDIQPEVTI